MNLFIIICRPWIEAGGSHTIDWIVNILEGRSEVEFDLATFRTNAKRLKGVTEGLALLRSKVW